MITGPDEGARPPRDEQRRGALFAVAAFGFRGLVPVYQKAVADVPAVEVLAHRIVWSFLLLAAGFVWQRGVAGCRRLRYATVGILQYVAPNLQLLPGVPACGEPFPPLRGPRATERAAPHGAANRSRNRVC